MDVCNFAVVAIPAKQNAPNCFGAFVKTAGSSERSALSSASGNHRGRHGRRRHRREVRRRRLDDLHEDALR
jgi:hypothetical protein